MSQPTSPEPEKNITTDVARAREEHRDYKRGELTCEVRNHAGKSHRPKISDGSRATVRVEGRNRSCDDVHDGECGGRDVESPGGRVTKVVAPSPEKAIVQQNA
ncbi:hypothetical protein H6P81_006258 [Aristolochia fimbriata]|uniref:Uncharacterized protein n=1 Tax=Aristolochia fimbriata TaxID=158543 RepID=A0AAV7EY73_ARIFI|nr:hypothetical protein H6P81_006258 [Aristolochia fimbriata]